jgi:hypothetical protein
VITGSEITLREDPQRLGLDAPHRGDPEKRELYRSAAALWAVFKLFPRVQREKFPNTCPD